MKRSPWGDYADESGRTIDAGTLGEEIAFPTAAGVRHVIGDAVASGLSPERLAQILRESATGYSRAYLTLAEEMEERYLHYASQLQTRRLALEGIPVSVEADTGIPKAIVDAVNDLIEDSDFDELVGALSDGIAKGYSVVEMIWEYQHRVLKPTAYKWRDPRFFVYDEETQSELRLAVDFTRKGQPLGAAKFIIHEPRSRMGLSVRRGMARPAAWAFLIQSFGLRDWASFAEIYGVPMRVGKYHSAASDADKRTLLRAVRAIANDAAAIIPSGMEIEFQKIEGQHGTAVFGGLIDYVDKQVSKLVLGQTMTSDDGASMAQAKVHNEVRLDIVTADAKQLARTINRDLIIPFVVMNFGEQALYPRVALQVAQPEDITALTSAVSTLVPLGLRVSQREMRERVGLSEPENDEELLVAAAAPAAPAGTSSPRTPPETKTAPNAKEKEAALSAHVTGCRCLPCLATLAASPAATTGVDEVEALAAAALGDWEDVTDPILAPLRHILSKARSFEDALKMLSDAGPDSARLVEALATSTAIARGIGTVRN